MSGVIRKTRLTGLYTPRYPRKELSEMYEKILRFISVLPEDYAYRKSTQNVIKERQKIINENERVEDIEQKINQGYIGELLLQARNELSLIELFIQEKPWENLVEKAPPHQWTWPPRK